MAGFTYSTLTTAILNYTEVGTGVLSSTITDQFIDNSELRILRDIPIDADRKELVGNLVASTDNVHAPAGTLFVRDLQVYTSTTAATGANSFLIKKDISYLREYDAAETTTGTPNTMLCQEEQQEQEQLLQDELLLCRHRARLLCTKFITTLDLWD